MGFQRKRQKNFQKRLRGQPVLTFDKRQIWGVSCQVCEWTLIELRFNIIDNALCLFFMVLIWVIFKSAWYHVRLKNNRYSD